MDKVQVVLRFSFLLHAAAPESYDADKGEDPVERLRQQDQRAQDHLQAQDVRLKDCTRSSV